MLETKPLPVTTSPRSAARYPSYAGTAAAAIPTRLPRPVADPAPTRRSARQTGRSRLARSEARLLAMAITATVVVCGLLVIYLAAYARVTLLGIDQATARGRLRDRMLQNETLKAEEAQLRSPARVAAAAESLGMTRGAKHIDYISLRPAGASRTVATTMMTDDPSLQAANSGTTQNNHAAADLNP